MPADPPSLLYTEHALTAMAEREISPEWVRRTVAAPDLRAPNPNDPDSEFFFRREREQGDRVLRVVVNTNAAPWRVVTVYFDRGMRGRL